MVAKNKSNGLFTPILVVVLLLLLVKMSYSVSAKETPKDTVKDIQKLRLTDSEGNIRAIQPSVVATVFVLLGSECPISQQCTKAVNELVNSYTNKGITFYGVIPGNHYAAADIQAFKNTYHIPFVVLMDTAYALTTALHGSITPQAIVTDSYYRIQYSGAIDNAYRELGRKNAHVTKHYLADALAAITQNRPITTPYTVPVGCLIATKTITK